MRWITSLFLLSTLLLQPAFAETSEKYAKVEPPAPTDSGDRIEVVEFFWYGCPHCYDLEKDIHKWAETKPDNVVFKQVPAPLNPRWTPHARFFYAAELVGMSEQLHGPLFKALHEERQPIFKEEQLIQFAVDHGADEEEFRKAWNSFPVNLKVQRARNLAKRYKITGVPALGVNGKYRTGSGMVRSHTELMEVLDGLIAEENNATQSGQPQARN